MKSFKWDEAKNARLVVERGISFEEVVRQIEQGGVLDVYDHPKQQKYKGQRIFVVKINDYAWLVPFVETEDEILLKTIIPSRKITKKYLRGSS
ncbi:BrnT family toxin [candidate division KSB1 bacterium]|nr:BrnT family toxin [candidate division KSB1 bacterium]